MDKQGVLTMVRKGLAQGEVSAEGLSLALQREFKKRSVEMAGVYRSPEGIILPKPLHPAEGIQKAAEYIFEQIKQNPQQGQRPLTSLLKYLDDTSRKYVEKAWREGRPVDMDTIKRALGSLYSIALQKRGETVAPGIQMPAMNRKQKRELKRLGRRSG